MALSPPWRSVSTGKELAAAIIALFDERGHEHYDEIVTQTQHAMQCADLAAADGAEDAVVVAALLHDLGHLLEPESSADGGADDFRQRDLHHEELGARFLTRWYPATVTQPIRLHVAAKRYLCATDAHYAQGLSAASVHSLDLQGGPMSLRDASAFASMEGAGNAIRLRRWDDLAKDPDVPHGGMGRFATLLARVAR